MNKQKNTAIPEKLVVWQRRLADSNSAYSDETAKMNKREALYGGENKLKPLVQGDHKRNGQPKKTSHVRNIIFENIESQVSASVPKPKVTPRRQQDERLAEILENFLRNELDRLPFENMNDMAERTVPIQGGVGFLVEWDNARRTHATVGEVSVSVIHPKQFAPQPGVYTGIEDMDWFILKIPTTKETVRRKYGKDVSGESESEPDVRRAGGGEPADDAVTQYLGYERNAEGGIDLYAWVNDIELEDLKNYQARRQPVCAKCGRVRPLPGQLIYNTVDDTLGAGPEPGLPPSGGLSLSERDLAGRLMADELAAQAMQPEAEAGGLLLSVPVEPPPPPEPERYDGGPCPWCGSDKFTSREQDYEQVHLPMTTPGGVEIPGAEPGFGADGSPVMQPTLIPFYKPDLFPVVLQRSVSVYGQFLGNSDVDAIRDQQNTINRLEQKILDRIVKAGTRVSLPETPNLRVDPEDSEIWRLTGHADKNMIGVYDFTGNLEYELMHLANVYEEARQILGITDSFQGRRDTTAVSGKAKEFAAAQSAGRLESKRVMKDAAYAAMFELMFKFWLAYSDEPRSVVYKNFKGENEYQEFNRYDFLERDDDGQWYWNDQFLFSCDTSDPLANNREAMWQETRLNFQTGAFGDPASAETLILFWSKMEELHYPGAGATKKFLEDRMERERQQAQQLQQMQMQAMQAQQAAAPAPAGQAPGPGGGQAPMPGAGSGAGQPPPELLQAVDQKARQDAMAAVRQSGIGAQTAR